jgi:Skp family chaperone for outer membrane proteins
VFQLRILMISVAAGAGLLAQPVAAQQNTQWFVPNQQRPATRPAPAQHTAPAVQSAVPGAEPGLIPAEGGQPGAEGQAQIKLPPPPEVPPLPKGPTPPAAIVGVLSLADVVRASTAFQQADKEFVTRRQKLNEDAQKEQQTLNTQNQSLANDRAKLTPEQIRTREKDLQDRITESRRVFGERNRVIQEASQYVMAQIDRAIEMVTQQVAISRGINVVLNRAQILGATPEFDMTPAVVEDLNKVLTKVIIPPEGVSPMNMKQSSEGAAPTTAESKPAPAKPATPAATKKP